MTGIGTADSARLLLSIECKRDSLPAVLKLLGEILREPTFPQEDFDVLKRQRRDMLVKSAPLLALLFEAVLQEAARMRIGYILQPARNRSGE